MWKEHSEPVHLPSTQRAIWIYHNSGCDRKWWQRYEQQPDNHRGVEHTSQTTAQSAIILLMETVICLHRSYVQADMHSNCSKFSRHEHVHNLLN